MARLKSADDIIEQRRRMFRTARDLARQPGVSDERYDQLENRVRNNYNIAERYVSRIAALQGSNNGRPSNWKQGYSRRQYAGAAKGSIGG
jgi:hypothetical protein